LFFDINSSHNLLVLAHHRQSNNDIAGFIFATLGVNSDFLISSVFSRVMEEIGWHFFLKNNATCGRIDMLQQKPFAKEISMKGQLFLPAFPEGAMFIGKSSLSILTKDGNVHYFVGADRRRSVIRDGCGLHPCGRADSCSHWDFGISHNTLRAFS
jgi:hypothetical protein